MIRFKSSTKDEQLWKMLLSTSTLTFLVHKSPWNKKPHSHWGAESVLNLHNLSVYQITIPVILIIKTTQPLPCPSVRDRLLVSTSVLCNLCGLHRLKSHSLTVSPNCYFHCKFLYNRQLTWGEINFTILNIYISNRMQAAS